MKRELVLGVVLAQSARERASTLEGRVHGMYLDMVDARALLKSILASVGKAGGNSARDREGRRDVEDDRRRLEQILERSEREARDLEREVKRLQDSLREQQDRQEARQAISEKYFRELTDTVRRRSLSRDKVSLIRLAAQNEWFTCAQLRELLGLVSFGSDQETVAVTIHPRLVDRGRFYTLSNAFRFSSSWRTVCGKLGLPL